MTRRILSVVVSCVIAGSAHAEEPLSPFSMPDTVWQLSELGGEQFEKESTIVFGAEGNVAGKALCNRFMGRAEWSADGLELGPLGTTMMACPDLEQERVVLQALSNVVAGAIEDDRLILTLHDGTQMVYLSGGVAP